MCRSYFKGLGRYKQKLREINIGKITTKEKEVLNSEEWKLLVTALPKKFKLLFRVLR